LRNYWWTHTKIILMITIKQNTLAVIMNNGEFYYYFGGVGVGFYIGAPRSYPVSSLTLGGSYLNVTYLPFAEINYLSNLLWGKKYSSSCKITFKRKGSWFHFRRGWPRFITLKVGYGHAVRLRYPDIYCLRRKKYLARHSLTVLSYSWHFIWEIGKEFRNWRYFGRYTKRGIRLARQCFYRQQGKESQYTKLKSKIF